MGVSGLCVGGYLCMWMYLNWVSVSIWVGCKCSVFEWCVCHCRCILIPHVKETVGLPGLGMRALGWECV